VASLESCRAPESNDAQLVPYPYPGIAAYFCWRFGFTPEIYRGYLQKWI
jgi:hypothetical protein